MKKTFLLLLFTLLATFNSFSQVTLFQAPQSRQLFPRGANDSAHVQVSGMVSQPGITHFIYKLSKAGSVIDSVIEPAVYNGNDASFQYTFGIKAERVEYAVHVSTYDGLFEDCILDADSLVAGDVFLINGQSNGSSPAQGPGAENTNEWIRTYGTGSFNDIEVAQDTVWGLGQSAPTQADFTVGVWGMKLGRLLTDSLQVPVCIINGSRYGTVISSHLPNLNNPQDLKTIYGRLLFRARKAKVDSHVKAMFWYQGESNTDTSYQFYASRFNQLYNFWKADYAGLNRIFVIQTRPGCILGTPYAYHQHMREVTRSLVQQYNDITLMSSVGIPNFDGCHFLSTGYNQLGTQLYYQVMRDVYGQSQPAEIDAAMPLSASFVNSSNTLLALRMSQNLTWPAVLNGNDLRNYFYFDQPGVNVVNGWTSNDTIYLELNTSSFAGKVTYLPGVYYNGTSQIYQGPWLLNNRGVGAMSFHEFPISNQIALTASGNALLCQGDSILLGSDKTGFSYQWNLNGSPLSGKTGTGLWVIASGDYSVTLTDMNGSSVTSNTLSVLQNSLPPVEINASANQICEGDTAWLNATQAMSWIWSDGSFVQSIPAISEGWYIVTAVDSNGCSSSDSAFLQVNDMPEAEIDFTGLLTACNGDSVKLFLHNNESGLWSNGINDSVIYVKTSGLYWVEVSTSAGCSVHSDTLYVNIVQTPVNILPNGPLSVCANQKVTLKADGTGFVSYQWNLNGVEIDGAETLTYKPLLSGTYSVSIIDSLGCPSTSQGTMVTIRNAPNATTTLTNQFDVCMDSVVTFTANGSSASLTYQWTRNGVVIPGATAKVLNTQMAGTYRVITTNVWGCTKNSPNVTIPVADLSVSITQTGSSIVCTGDSVQLTATSAAAVSYQWIRNNVPVAGATNAVLYAKKTGYYKVTVQNAMGCTATSSNKYLSFSNCGSGNLGQAAASRLDGTNEGVSVNVYPNPFVESFSIDFADDHAALNLEVRDITGRVVISSVVPENEQRMEVGLAGVSDGAYFLILTQNGVQTVTRIQKQSAN